jgi:hypothetical protein
MTFRRACLVCLSALTLVTFASCKDDDDRGNPDGNRAGKNGAAGSASESGGSAGSGAQASGGSPAAGGTESGGSAPSLGGSAGDDAGGAPSQAGAGTGGSAGAGGSGGSGFPPECGDPTHEGVVVYQDIASETSWTCPVYTLTQPIYVHSTSDTPTVLHIAPGVTIRGVKGTEGVKLPGALIVTRSARLDAVGTADKPIVFTTSEPAASAGPGSWGGLMLLGRATVNAPANFEESQKPAGEVYAEALPKTPLGLYGWPKREDGGGADGSGGAAGSDGGAHAEELESWSCGTLRYARINFAGFKAGSTKELNGLTIGGCGSDTVIDHVQVHRSSDDGIEIFGGNVNLSHIVLTGNQDDSLDWDQGWRGKAQFVAIQTHDDADSADSCGIEADGYATPAAPTGEPSAPRLFNLSLILSKSTQRGLRLRDGTQAFVGNALLVSHAMGVPQGLIDVDGVSTADALAAGKLVVTHSVFRGVWPAVGQADSLGTVYLEQDHFTGSGAGSEGNDVISAAGELWLNAFNTSAPEWVPGASTVAAEHAVAPSDLDGSDFFDVAAAYRGAFAPGGQDWTAGWTSYP